MIMFTGFLAWEYHDLLHEKEEGLRQNKVTYVNKIKINASCWFFYLYTVGYDNNIFGGELGIFGGVRESFYPSNTLDRTLAACKKDFKNSIK